VVQNATSDAHRSTYFDDFGATALHLWATGLPDQLTSWSPDSSRAWVSWVNNDGTGANGQVIGGLGADPPGRIGYQVGDEPRTQQDLDAMGAGVQAVHAADPAALAWINLCCTGDIDVDHYVDTAVLTYGADLVSYDQYARSRDAFQGLELFRDAALRNHVPWWRYAKSYREPDESLEELQESDLRWDAMSGVLYGYTGHTWFLYQIDANPDLEPALFENDLSMDAARTPLFDVVAQLNRELLALGETMSQLTSTDVRYRAAFTLTRPEHTEAFQAGAGGDPYLADVAPDSDNLLELMIGLFVDDAGERYFAVQNARHEHGEWPVGNSESGAVRLSLDFTGAPAAVRRDRLLVLDAVDDELEAVALSGSGDARGVVFTLAAGELRLFKYDTGAPFARRAGSW